MELDQKKIIVMVEDGPFMRSLYCQSLECEGFNLPTAPDGRTGVDNQKRRKVILPG